MVATVPYAVEKAVEKSASTTDETASTSPSRLDERAAEAQQLYNPLQLYSYTSSTLYNPLQHPSEFGPSVRWPWYLFLQIDFQIV